MLKVGIIGSGKMGKVYARWFAANPYCEVVAFYNRTRERAEDISRQYRGATVYDTWEALIGDPAIDIIGICTPSHQHLAQIRLGLQARKHILCEKPLANDIYECQTIVKLSQAASSKLMVGFQMRFHPVVTAVDRLLDRIGRIYHAEFVFNLYRPGVTWRHRLTQGGGVLKELSSHLLDLMQHWVGDISAVTGLNKIIDTAREVEDYSVNLLEFRDGAAGFLFSSYLDRRSSSIHGNLLGLTGQLTFQFSPYDPADSRLVLFTDDNDMAEIPITIPSEIDDIYPGHLDSFQREIDHFVHCIVHDERPIVTALEGLRALEVINASYESTRRGGERISLPLTEFSRSHLKDCFPKFGGEG